MPTSHIEGNVAEIISKTRLIITPGKDENIKIGDSPATCWKRYRS